MDWGLLDKNAGENLLLREQIVYDYKVGDNNMYLEQHSHVWTAKYYCNVQENSWLLGCKLVEGFAALYYL